MAVMVYALSTCPYCKAAKKFLDESSVAYDTVDVDLLEGEQRETTIAKVKDLSGGTSFPVIDIDGEVVVGYNKARIKQLLKL